MWLDARRSTFRVIGLPEKFGEVLLLLSLIFCLSPYFSGSDFGILKIPSFLPGVVQVLKIVGPIALLLCIFLYLPIWRNAADESKGVSSPPDKLEARGKRKVGIEPKGLSSGDVNSDRDYEERPTSLARATAKKSSRRASVRISNATCRNPELRVESSKGYISNVDWLKKYGSSYLQTGSLLLVGGTSLTDFRLRVAQSNMRSDLLPSLWSHVAVINESSAGKVTLFEINLTLSPEEITKNPNRNAIRESNVNQYANPECWPNVAVISFPVEGRAVSEAVSRLKFDRSIFDFSDLVMHWMEFLMGDSHPPDIGIPSAVFTSTIMDMAGLKLTPDLDHQFSSPEVIWQSAQWWYKSYKETVGRAPKGVYITRQPAAAVIDQR